VPVERDFSNCDSDTCNFDARVGVSHISITGVCDLLIDISDFGSSFLVSSGNLFVCGNWSLWSEPPRKLILQRNWIGGWASNHDGYGGDMLGCL